MKLLFDQNISPRILKILPGTLYNSTHVNFNKLQDKSDLEISIMLKEEANVLLLKIRFLMTF